MGPLAPITENPLVIRTWLVRVGLAALAVVNAWWGAWAYVAPRNFFDTFPGFGHHWTAETALVVTANTQTTVVLGARHSMGNASMDTCAGSLMVQVYTGNLP